MTNKAIDGVPRELIERVTKPLTIHDDLTDRIKARDELRALLDAPVECRCKRYGKDNPHWPCPAHAAPAAQPQGEPVTLDERALYDAWRESNLGYVRPFNKYEWSAWQARARIAEQPAQGAVEKLSIHSTNDGLDAYRGKASD